LEFIIALQGSQVALLTDNAKEFPMAELSLYPLPKG
jgi:hypothetical protein